MNVKQNTCFKIDALTYPVYIGTDFWHVMDLLLQSFAKSGGIYILTDHNTQKFCLPVLFHHLPELARQPSFSISPGEGSKDLINLDKVWKWLLETGAARDSLLINLGGGVVSDLGGFAASTFKRGIHYLNIPTSLIGQVDAAVGGKTGINISGVKNQVGHFYDPVAVFINPDFLTTLPDLQMKSGYAEIIKCAALSGNGFWECVKKNNFTEKVNIPSLIAETVNFKCKIVAEDPFDLSTRKMLNFGHTVGHALESLANLQGKDERLHGEAVAAGMICESYLSFETAGLPEYELVEIITGIKSHFDLKPIETRAYDQLIKIMGHDKKKSKNKIDFSLLKSLGNTSFDSLIDRDNLIRSFEYHNTICHSDKNK